MKCVTGVYVFVVVYNVLDSSLLCKSYRDAYETSFHSYNRRSAFLIMFYPVKNVPRSFSNNIVTKNRNKSDSKKRMKHNYMYYTNMCVCYNGIYDDYVDYPETYDTLSQIDVVVKQYRTLPYPAVSNQQLAREKSYYDNAYNIRRPPYNIHYGITFEALNHYLYKGRNTFMLEFRTLIPGGGTDGGVLFMAEQVNSTNSEVVYIDFSQSSITIMQFRLEMRRCLKVVWVMDWIENIPRLGLGNFDFAVSTGVMHHLKSPQKGLKIINDVQFEIGGAEFMVYGKYARTGIYHLQELLRIINQKELHLSNEIKNAKSIFNTLPNYNWFKNREENSEHNTMGDVGIYDLLLHKRDIAFTMADLYSWLENSGYNLVDFTHAENAMMISLKTVIDDRTLLEKLSRMHTPIPHEMGELICSIVYKHDVYVSKQQNSEASLSLTEDVVYIHGSPLGILHAMTDESNYRLLRNKAFVYTKFLRIIDSESFIGKYGEYTGDFIWPSTEFNDFVIGSLVRKPIRPQTLLSMITDFKETTKSNLTIKEGVELFEDLYSYIKDFKMFFFKHKSIPSFPLTCCRTLYRVFSR